ncbi:MAG TPA: efflux RND transporter permease subunit [Planctomycetaceae bacterium]|nr:efflux RND transporter permease subunit [Planctomycetaceae bacterium]
MNPVIFALRRPWTVIATLIAIALTCCLAVRPKAFDDWLEQYDVSLPIKRVPVDIFPSLNLPMICVAQPYGGMDPAQMEGLLTNYYEYHFLYISGIHHVESKNVQGMALMRLYFHPGTDMAQAMAETINFVNRSRAFMPTGTVAPFVMRFDTGSLPVGYLVLSSATRTITEIQDQALFKVRPMFSALPGVSAPPPFGGSARTIVVRTDPERLRSYGLSADDLIDALSRGNSISPSGNLHVGDRYPQVPTNSLIKNISDFGTIPIRTGALPVVYLRDVATIEDAADLTVGYSLVNGRRAVYILATKRADASTLSVIGEIKRALPAMQRELPDDIKVSFEFDQSPYVTDALSSLVYEGVLGALLTGLAVLFFLRDVRSAIVVVLNIPLAIMAALVALWLSGQTINLMTLGGLALAVGILVDEATVEIENIQTQMARGGSIAWAVRRGNAQTAVPRLLAMLCIVALFIPSFFLSGPPRSLFMPLSLAVGFAMIASYILSSTLVPVLSVWLLRHRESDVRNQAQVARTHLAALRRPYQRILTSVLRLRSVVLAAYAIGCVLLIGFGWSRLGIDIFPAVDAGEFRLRLRAPEGSHVEETERLALRTLDIAREIIGPQNIAITLGYVGEIPSAYPINAVYQFSRGPEEAILRIALKKNSGISTERLKERLREELAQRLPGVRFSFEPADIVSEVMSFGATTPIEVAVRGGTLDDDRVYMAKVQQALSKLPELRDVQVAQSLDYPSVDVTIDRERAGLSGVTANEVSRSVLAATSSSRFVVPNFWPDPKTGIGYQVQVEIPQRTLKSADELGAVPVLQSPSSPVLLRDVAQLTANKHPGEYDRYNMKRELSLNANLSATDLGRAANRVTQALATVQRQADAERESLEKAGQKVGRVTYELRGQIPALKQMLSGLGVGLVLAVVVIFLLLTANFQSMRLAIVALSGVPAVIAGVLLTLWISGSSLNIESFIGAIMAIGVSMANAILLVTFAEQERRRTQSAAEGAIQAASSRLRPILMTTCAMVAGMIPIAISFGESGQQSAPLGRAVIGGLAASSLATLFVLPAIFGIVQGRAKLGFASLDPEDPQSEYFAAAPSEELGPQQASFSGKLVRNWTPWFAVVLVWMTASGCQHAAEIPATVEVSASTAPAPASEDLVRARVVRPARKTLVKRIEQPGQIDAFARTPVLAKVSGYVRRVLVDIGDHVYGPKFDERGNLTHSAQVLAELWAPELEETWKQKQAVVAQTVAEIEQAQAAIQVAQAARASAESEVAQAQAATQRDDAAVKRWESQFRRMTELAASKSIEPKLVEETQEQLRGAHAALDSAEAHTAGARAKLREALAHVEKTKADLKTAESRRRVAEATEAKARAERDYLTIGAPFDGIVTARNVDPGHLTRVGGTPADTPLFVVVDPSVVRIFVDVPESDAVRIQSGQEAEVRVPALAGELFRGHVARTAWLLAAATRTLRTEIDVPNPEGRLRPGMYAQAILPITEQKNGFVLPASAVVGRGAQAFCLGVDDQGQVRRIALKAGVEASGEVEVLAGLSGGERVIRANPAAYREGQRVAADEQ